MNNNFLTHIFIFLAAAAIIVPIASRFKLGSVLGYLVIGVLIGPYGFKLLGNAEQIMHFAEFGIVMMLFLIGLELEPEMLWRLRRAIIGLGSLQVILTTTMLTLIGILLQYKWQESLAVGMALALSSTALVLQMLEEKNLLRTVEGETSFAVLLFQDIAVIPILIILPLLAPVSLSHLSQFPNEFIVSPRWLHALFVIGVISAIILMGHYLSHRLFFIIAKTNLREVFTATSLAIVTGITLLMQTIGASPALGAFIAGVVLANSQYKHTLEMDIEPFKGLLLGLFFISVGMGMDFSLFKENPLTIIITVLIIITIKACILILLGHLFGLIGAQRIGFALALSQVGEFAFVLFQYAGKLRVISTETAHLFNLIVALSMAFTPVLMLIYSRFVIPKYLSKIPNRKFDEIEEKNPIILAGYGRFGQIIGRFLRAQDTNVTILEKDPEQIELLRKYGFQGYFGDATRLDILRHAGANRAKILIVAVGDIEVSLKIIRLAKQYFPNLKIYARARNRRHAYDIYKEGVDYFKRETFDSSLIMARDIMIDLGHSPESIRRKAKLFAKFDEKSLHESFDFFEKEHELIRHLRHSHIELERILQSDQQIDKLYSRHHKSTKAGQ
ncbi:monovalent cation:proton antiporter-2 (CPA2) family protein [Legionella sp. CNM-1927-20]|uniref:monovalent cation:proton antiporter-2 (CPA2) family protein n=1 Tax=Legionella sp. CNM-1927-20 TaxID=3422221 RepID=UPI00403AE572